MTEKEKAANTDPLPTGDENPINPQESESEAANEKAAEQENPVEEESSETGKQESDVKEKDEELKEPAQADPVDETSTEAEKEMAEKDTKDKKPARTGKKTKDLTKSVSEEKEEEEEDTDEAFIKELNAKQDQDTDESEEEEEDLEEEESGEPAEKFDELPREKLVELLEETVKEQDVQKIKTRVALIKVAFLKQTRREEQEQYEQFLKEGGEKDSYAPPADALLEKFDQAFDIYRKNKIRFNEEQEVLKLRNLDAKKQILEELKELINSEESLKKTYDQFKELQQRWKEAGLVPSGEIHNLWQSYHFLVEKFFDKVKISRELRDLDLKKNLEMKMELCEKAEELLLETSIVKSFKQLQKYHEEWKEIGPVPADKRDEIWERFKTATDKINERRREYYVNISQQQEQNLLAKSALCDQAEELIAGELKSIKEWQNKTKEINELFNVWKTIGPAPKKDNDAIWERFKTCLNTFFSNKKEFFNQLKHEQINNYNLKLDIVKQAEAMKDSTDWKDTTHELIRLQKEWKEIGPVPRKYSDKIWKRFRAACDEFFNNKSAYFSNIGDREKENLQKKEELVKKVIDFKFSNDKNENLETIKEFQREWTEIGHVPIKEKDKIHQAFREAINARLDDLNIDPVEVRTIDYQARIENMKENPNSNKAIRREMGFIAGKISKLREEINLWENNIGFLAHSKRADLLKVEFEKKINKAKEELALSEAKYRYLQDSLD